MKGNTAEVLQDSAQDNCHTEVIQYEFRLMNCYLQSVWTYGSD